MKTDYLFKHGASYLVLKNPAKEGFMCDNFLAGEAVIFYAQTYQPITRIYSCYFNMVGSDVTRRLDIHTSQMNVIERYFSLIE